MEQYIKKSALVAEIERLRGVQPFGAFQPKEQNKADWLAGKLFTLASLDTFIDTLEVKEVDLEEAIDDYIYIHDGRKRLALELDWKCCNLTLKGGDEIIKFARHFFELGLNAAQKGEEI